MTALSLREFFEALPWHEFDRDCYGFITHSQTCLTPDRHMPGLSEADARRVAEASAWAPWREIDLRWEMDRRLDESRVPVLKGGA